MTTISIGPDRDDTPAKNAPLYMRVMGDSWTQIAESVRGVHATSPIVRAHGQLRIQYGRHPMARLLARVLRLPQACAVAEARLIVTARADGEHWQRTFNGRRLDTWQFSSKEFELAERFGIFELRFRLEVSGGSLLYVQRDAAFLFGPVRLRLPVSWAPRVEAREDPAGPKRILLDVRVTLPGIGRLITYDGIIDVEDTPV